MIRNFADREAEKIWAGTPSRRLHAGIQGVARRKLRMGLQADYDLEEAHRALGAVVSRIERLAA